MKKLIALLLALVLVVSCFAGCDNNAPVDPDTDTPSNNENPAPDGTDEAPAVSDDPFDGTHDIVEVTWCINGDPQAEDEAVLAAVNKLLEERYNLHLNLEGRKKLAERFVYALTYYDE